MKYFAIVSGGVLVGVLLLGLYVATDETAVVSAEEYPHVANASITIYHSEGCNCCSGYAAALRELGTAVTIETLPSVEMIDLKKRYDIEVEQQSCHTAVVDEYVVEGHVPMAALEQLLTAKPAVSGITLPGMPIGTPGMPGRKTETFEVATLAGDKFWQN